MKIYIVSSNIPYEGSYVEEVFSNLNKARDFVEKHDDFKGWSVKFTNMTVCDRYDYYLDIEEYEVK